MLPEHASSAGPRALLDRARAELERRLRAGEPCRAEQILYDYPLLSSDSDAAVALIVAEFHTRRELGERPDAAEYCVRFPQWSVPLEHALAALHAQASDTANETESSGGSQPTGPDAVAPLGLHEVYEEVGHGGMGIVYRARDLALGREVAIKRIRSGALTGREVQRFYREARAAAQLRHPNLLPIYAVGLHEGSPCYTMPLVKGGTLGDHLDRYRQGQPRAAVTLLAKVARAVDAAHRAGIIHRDLKPGNLLLDEHGEPLVADFGLAKVVNGEAPMTRTGQAVGTPPYMAPEQLPDQPGPITAAADIWALGVILFQVLTGARPFAGRGQLLETQILGAEARWPRTLPRSLGAIVLKCLEKSPAQRYGSATELADDLEAWRDGRPTRVQPPRGMRRVLRGLRRRPRLTGFAMIAFLTALLGSAALYLTHPGRALWQLQEELKPGATVELIGVYRRAALVAILGRRKDGNAYTGEDGVFTVHGWPLTLLELLPDTGGQHSYVIHADVRHVKGGDSGEVGLYFAGTSHDETMLPVRSFLYVSFDNLHDMVEQYNRQPEEIKRRIAKCTGNSVRLSWRCIEEPDKHSPIPAVSFLNPELFRPSGFQGKPADWVRVRVDVDAERVAVTWGERNVGTVTRTRIVQRLRGATARQLQQDPNDPATARLQPRLDLDGSVGLYLYESFASFRNVRIELRPAPVNSLE